MAREMKYSTLELYGINPIDLTKMNYKDALELKIIGAKWQLKKMCAEDRHLTSLASAIYKSINFNQELLDELKGDL